MTRRGKPFSINEKKYNEDDDERQMAFGTAVAMLKLLFRSN